MIVQVDGLVYRRDRCESCGEVETVCDQPTTGAICLRCTVCIWWFHALPVVIKRRIAMHFSAATTRLALEPPPERMFAAKDLAWLDTLR